MERPKSTPKSSPAVSAQQFTSETATGKTVAHQYDTWGNETVRTTTQGTTTTETYGYNHLNLLASYTNSATGANRQYCQRRWSLFEVGRWSHGTMK